MRALIAQGATMPFRLALGFAAAALLGAGTATAGDWVRFHSYSGPKSPNKRLDYYYARSSVRSAGGRVRVQQEILGRDPRTVTLYTIELDCGRGTMTELSNSRFDPKGDRWTPAPSALWVDQPVLPGTSGEALMAILCPQF